MPKIAKELGALEVSRLKETGMHAVGGVPGLHLQIIGGARSWVLRVKVGAKRRDMGLGGFPAVTLAQAREKARQAREMIAAGEDPILARKRAASALLASQARAITFDDAARMFIDEHSAAWKNDKHGQQWVNTLATYASPHIGKLLVSDIGQEHVMAVLRPIWHEKTETARRVRGRIEKVLDWATVQNFREGENPARWKGRLEMLLASPDGIAKVKNHEALPIDDVPAFLADIRKLNGVAARALELLVLTAARSGEVRGATWSEIDFDKATWTIPAARMKAEKEHRIPLSIPALALLSALPRHESSDLVFLGRDGTKPISDMTMTKIMRRMELEAVPHGFRSTFRDWAGERTSFPREVIEHALAHQLKDKAEAAYARGTLFEKRRKLMEAWAAFCEQPAQAMGAVVPLAREKEAA